MDWQSLVVLLGAVATALISVVAMTLSHYLSNRENARSRDAGTYPKWQESVLRCAVKILEITHPLSVNSDKREQELLAICTEYEIVMSTECRMDVINTMRMLVKCHLSKTRDMKQLTELHRKFLRYAVSFDQALFRVIVHWSRGEKVKTLTEEFLENVRDYEQIKLEEWVD